MAQLVRSPKQLGTLIGHDWLADFKRNTPAIYERIAAIYLVPFLAMLALLTAIGAAARSRYRHPLGE